MTADTPQMLQAGEHPSDAWTMIRPGSLASARLAVAVCADSYAALQVRLESTYALGDQLADELANLLADLPYDIDKARALTAWFEHRNPETDDDGD